MSCCSSSTKDNMCPMRMNDGRVFTDYRPRCMVNNDIVSELTKQDMINSSYESRMYLQRNAEQIIEKQMKDAMAKVNCLPCSDKVNTMLPESYMIHCDTVSCQRQQIDSNGLGDGRKY